MNNLKVYKSYKDKNIVLLEIPMVDKYLEPTQTEVVPMDINEYQMLCMMYGVYGVDWFYDKDKKIHSKKKLINIKA